MPSKTWAAGLACLLCLCLSSAAFAGDFFDTRLSFVFADDNVLASAGETTPSSPSAHFGANNQNNQFYDNFNTKYSGFETLSNIALYKKVNAFFPGLTAEASLVILALEQPSGVVELRDNSSYIRLNYHPASWGKGEGIALTGFPVSADRFRLGYAYKVSWGGSDVFTEVAAEKHGVPGVKLQLTKKRWYAFVGLKTALVYNNLILEEETQYGLLAGAGVDILPILRLEANGGYFQKGINPDLAGQAHISAPVDAAGISAEAVLHVGVPVGRSVDLTLYRNDPTLYKKLFAPEQYPKGVSYRLSIEGDFLRQTLEDPDVFGKTVPQNAYAVALQARVKWNYLRVHVLGLYRTLSYMQFNVPGLPPYKDFPAGTQVHPDEFIAVGLDYYFAKLHLTPGIIAGVQMPASFSTPNAASVLGGSNPAQDISGQRTVVVPDVGVFSVLPTGDKALPVFSAKATFRWDLATAFAAIGEIYYTHNPNEVTFKDSESGIAEPTYQKPDGIGFNLIVQARF